MRGNGLVVLSPVISLKGKWLLYCRLGFGRFFVHKGCYAIYRVENSILK